MRIREIELVGFKSFREPTRLVFSAGLNAIVGPNGCGKSNVSDAVRWVLGEQSARHLRIDSMEDVIFCGNHRSAPLNFAEVTLIFEQADGAALGLAEGDDGLAARVARLPEFTITRRLFRSGESHYLVNGAPARLRDITEIFLGSGVGPKAYAMIEQGRVGQIVAAKPEEMRLFIEEAAGTTRFRSRKIAAERKLLRTQENLARVHDVLREIERQLGHLRRQARRAEEFKSLEADLRSEENALAAHRWAEVQHEARRLGEEMRVAAEALSAVHAGQQASLERRDRAIGRQREASVATEHAVEALGEIAATVARLADRGHALERMAEDLDTREERLAIEVEGLESRLGALDGEVVGAEAEVAAAQMNLEEFEASGARAEEAWRAALPALEGAETAFAEEQSAGARSRSEVAAASARRVDLAARHEGLEVELRRATERLAQLIAERERGFERERIATVSEAEARRVHGELEEGRRAAASEVRFNEGEARRCEEDRRGRREALRHIQGRLDALRDRETALEGYGEGVAAALTADPPPLGLVVDALEIPSEFERAVAAALGDAVRGMLVATSAHALAVLAWVRERGQGRVVCCPWPALEAPLDVVAPGPILADFIADRPGFEGLARALLGRVLVVDELEYAVASETVLPQGWIGVTRAGDVIDARGIFTGGQEPADTGLLERRREISELERALDSEARSVAESSERLERIRQVCADAGDRLSALDRRAYEATLTLVAAEHERDAALRDRTLADKRLDEGRLEVEERSRRRATVSANLETARGDESEAQARLGAAEAALEGRARALDETREVARVAREVRDSSREAASAAREALIDRTSVLSRLSHEQREARRRAEGVGRDREELRLARSRVDDEAGGLRRDEDEARVHLARLEDAVANARQEAASAAEGVTEAEQECAAVGRRMSAAEEARRSVDVAAAANAAQQDALVESVKDRLGIDIDTLLCPEDWCAEGASDRIRTIRERIARLGDVNVAAIADVRELEERETFLGSQKGDLETSIEDLRKTITDLSKATRVRFRETFEEANRLFQETFKELFRGGHAELKLTNAQNLLETGVEIEVQPPGKQVRSLAMLSGGEKALTAVSLIMALFSLRPTPFCLLDEVDAPLDDANVGRFNAMLQRMSASTQFIVITHKQRTMESANALYGVTMPEAGVSQVVSVEMSEGEQLARTASA